MASKQRHHVARGQSAFFQCEKPLRAALLRAGGAGFDGVGKAAREAEVRAVAAAALCDGVIDRPGVNFVEVVLDAQRVGKLL